MVTRDGKLRSRSYDDISLEKCFGTTSNDTLLDGFVW